MKELLIILVVFLCIGSVAKSQERISRMSISERDSILVEIAQKVLKDCYPKQYRKDGINPVIEKCVFEHEASYYKNNPTPVPIQVTQARIRLVWWPIGLLSTGI